MSSMYMKQNHSHFLSVLVRSPPVTFLLLPERSRYRF